MSTDQPLDGLSVLLVEDDHDGREMLSLYLRHAGAAVVTASTAVEGLEHFKAAPPAIVLTDIAMPEHDGIWLLRQIRSILDGRRVPVVALTARATARDRDLFHRVGFDAHVVKPVELEDVVRVILTLTNRS